MKINDVIELLEINPQILIIIDKHQIERAIKVNDILSVLWDFDQWLREEYKYRENEAAEAIREKLHEYMVDNSVDLEKLYS